MTRYHRIKHKHVEGVGYVPDFSMPDDDEEDGPEQYFCYGCDHLWESKDNPDECPKCGSPDIKVLE